MQPAKSKRRERPSPHADRGYYAILTIWCDKIQGFDPQSETHMEQLFNTEPASGSIAYARWQLERCPDTERLHVQAFVQFRERQGVVTAGRCLGLEPGTYSCSFARTRIDRCRLYASKRESSAMGYAYEWGTYVAPSGGNGTKRGQPGARMDLHIGLRKIAEGGR